MIPRDEPNSLKKLVSGGQTGVDRAALDVGIALGIPIGGWCPKGRRAEDGVIDKGYPLRETGQDAYAQRTELNVRDSEGTLIVTQGELRGGTALTSQFTRHYRRPCLIVDPDDPQASSRIITWIVQFDIAVLNVAGPRESDAPGMYDKANALLRKALQRVANSSEDTV